MRVIKKIIKELQEEKKLEKHIIDQKLKIDLILKNNELLQNEINKLKSQDLPLKKTFLEKLNPFNKKLTKKYLDDIENKLKKDNDERIKAEQKLKELLDNHDKLINILSTYKDFNVLSKDMYKIFNVTKPLNMFHVQGHKNNLINKFNPTKSFLINMELSNGKYAQFIIKNQDGGFIFKSGYYIINEQGKKYNESARMYSLTYHEELALPINTEIDIKKVKDEIDNRDIELNTALNPTSLSKFMTSTVIQKLLAGAEMENALSFIKMIVIINLIISVLMGLLLINMSGII